MAQNSNIEWTHHTFNPVRGCTKVSPGCANCYAARDSVRFPSIRGVWGDSGTRIVAVPDAWKAPLKWNRNAEHMWQCTCGFHEKYYSTPIPCPQCKTGTPVKIRPRVFCASLADIFEDWLGELRFPADIAPDGWVPAFWDGTQLIREFERSGIRQGHPKATMDNLRTELFRLIEATPNLDWQLLTKRPENVLRMIPDHWRQALPPNIWLGTTCENQEMADQRIPQLLQIPARIRFLSCEPLLGPVDLRNVEISPDHFIDSLFLDGDVEDDTKFKGAVIHWVICGGESGPKARPMHPDWARSLRDQCAAADVPFFFKQWGEWAQVNNGPILASTTVRPAPWNMLRDDDIIMGNAQMRKLGKAKAGNHLDGQLHQAVTSK